MLKHKEKQSSSINNTEDQKVVPLEQLEAQLGYSADGLSTAEAQKRLESYGYNELTEEKTNPLRRFLSYFWGPIAWMIETAIILSALVQHWADFGIILVLLVVNAIVGFSEEYQAGNAIAALKARLALNARVKRAGQWSVIPTRELVPGDLIRTAYGRHCARRHAAARGRFHRG